MARGSSLTHEECEIVRGYLAQGLNVTKIAFLLDRSYNTIRKYILLNKQCIEEAKQNSVSKRDQQKIMKMLNDNINEKPINIIKKLKSKSSSRTIRRFIHAELIKRNPEISKKTKRPYNKREKIDGEKITGTKLTRSKSTIKCTDDFPQLKNCVVNVCRQSFEEHGNFGAPVSGNLEKLFETVPYMKNETSAETRVNVILEKYENSNIVSALNESNELDAIIPNYSQSIKTEIKEEDELPLETGNFNLEISKELDDLFTSLPPVNTTAESTLIDEIIEKSKNLEIVDKNVIDLTMEENVAIKNEFSSVEPYVSQLSLIEPSVVERSLIEPSLIASSFIEEPSLIERSLNESDICDRIGKMEIEGETLREYSHNLERSKVKLPNPENIQKNYTRNFNLEQSVTKPIQSFANLFRNPRNLCETNLKSPIEKESDLNQQSPSILSLSLTDKKKINQILDENLYWNTSFIINEIKSKTHPFIIRKFIQSEIEKRDPDIKKQFKREGNPRFLFSESLTIDEQEKICTTLDSNNQETQKNILKMLQKSKVCASVREIRSFVRLEKVRRSIIKSRFKMQQRLEFHKNKQNYVQKKLTLEDQENIYKILDHNVKEKFWNIMSQIRSQAPKRVIIKFLQNECMKRSVRLNECPPKNTVSYGDIKKIRQILDKDANAKPSYIIASIKSKARTSDIRKHIIAEKKRISHSNYKRRTSRKKDDFRLPKSYGLKNKTTVKENCDKVETERTKEISKSLASSSSEQFQKTSAQNKLIKQKLFKQDPVSQIFNQNIDVSFEQNLVDKMLREKLNSLGISITLHRVDVSGEPTKSASNTVTQTVDIKENYSKNSDSSSITKVQSLRPDKGANILKQNESKNIYLNSNHTNQNPAELNTTKPEQNSSKYSLNEANLIVQNTKLDDRSVFSKPFTNYNTGNNNIGNYMLNQSINKTESTTNSELNHQCKSSFNRFFKIINFLKQAFSENIELAKDEVVTAKRDFFVAHPTFIRLTKPHKVSLLGLSVTDPLLVQSDRNKFNICNQMKKTESEGEILRQNSYSLRSLKLQAREASGKCIELTTEEKVKTKEEPLPNEQSLIEPSLVEQYQKDNYTYDEIEKIEIEDEILQEYYHNFSNLKLKSPNQSEKIQKKCAPNINLEKPVVKPIPSFVNPFRNLPIYELETNLKASPSENMILSPNDKEKISKILDENLKRKPSSIMEEIQSKTHPYVIRKFIQSEICKRDPNAKKFFAQEENPHFFFSRHLSIDDQEKICTILDRNPQESKRNILNMLQKRNARVSAVTIRRFVKQEKDRRNLLKPRVLIHTRKNLLEFHSNKQNYVEKKLTLEDQENICKILDKNVRERFWNIVTRIRSRASNSIIKKFVQNECLKRHIRRVEWRSTHPLSYHDKKQIRQILDENPNATFFNIINLIKSGASGNAIRAYVMVLKEQKSKTNWKKIKQREYSDSRTDHLRLPRNDGFRIKPILKGNFDKIVRDFTKEISVDLACSPLQSKNTSTQPIKERLFRENSTSFLSPAINHNINISSEKSLIDKMFEEKFKLLGISSSLRSPVDASRLIPESASGKATEIVNSNAVPRQVHLLQPNQELKNKNTIHLNSNDTYLNSPESNTTESEQYNSRDLSNEPNNKNTNLGERILIGKKFKDQITQNEIVNQSNNIVNSELNNSFSCNRFFELPDFVKNNLKKAVNELVKDNVELVDFYEKAKSNICQSKRSANQTAVFTSNENNKLLKYIRIWHYKNIPITYSILEKIIYFFAKIKGVTVPLYWDRMKTAANVFARRFVKRNPELFDYLDFSFHNYNTVPTDNFIISFLDTHT